MIWRQLLRARLALALLGCLTQVTLITADDAPGDGGITLPVTQLDPDRVIPTIRETLGYDWATRITSHTGMEKFLQALAQAAPDRAQLVRYGESYEGRGLYYLVITSPENLRRLEEIRRNNLKLADPRRTSLTQAGRLMTRMPALVWLASSVHGNELSSTEAALLTCYHLLADQRDETKELLQRLVVLIDPLQNPDGHERFVNVYRESRGVFDNAHPLSTEHTERWPGGRFNHYLFDMNRDWFLQSQQETVHKVQAYLKWQPQIYVDAHEMGRNSTYFFVPPADPVNPFMLPKQQQWLHQLGQHQAGWFDRYGFAYTTREMFDAFYPGYGSEWPTLQGGLGILWEQAGVRGLRIDRDDETTLHYRDAVAHHYVSSLATLEVAAQRREELLSNFFAARSRGVQLGEEGPVRHFLLPLQPHPSRTTRLAQLLRRNGIDVCVVPADAKVAVTDARTGEKTQQLIAEGSFLIPVAQPAGRLVRALLDRHVEMDEDFVTKQLQRKDDYLPDQLYDVTAWSLPLAFDVPCWATGESLDANQLWSGKANESDQQLSEAQVAYLVRPTDGACQALCQWLQQGIRAHVTSQALTLGTQEFPPGTLILKRHENPASLHQSLGQAVRQFGLEVTAADTGFVTAGAHFGGPDVRWVRPPKIALVVDYPARYSVGHTWHLFDEQLRYPTTRVGFQHLSGLDLDDFNVLILPEGNYTGDAPLGADFDGRLKQWVREGGTLILLGNAAVWAADTKKELVELKRVARPRPQDAKPEGADVKEVPERWPDGVPGAFLKAALFAPHWLTFGCQKTMNVFVNGNIFFEPPDPEKGRCVVQFAEGDDLLASGFCWPETEKLIAGKAYLACFTLGQGHVVAFAGDPNYRAMFPSLQRLFINACLFGPGQ